VEQTIKKGLVSSILVLAALAAPRLNAEAAANGLISS
jgi:hypothetical protein